MHGIDNVDLRWSRPQWRRVVLASSGRHGREIPGPFSNAPLNIRDANSTGGWWAHYTVVCVFNRPLEYQRRVLLAVRAAAGCASPGRANEGRLEQAGV